MTYLLDMNSTYLLVTPQPNFNGYGSLCEKYTSIAHSYGYNSSELISSDQDLKYSKSFLSHSSDNDNNKLRENAIKILAEFSLESIIIKYYGEDKPKLIMNNGSERLLDVSFYENQIYDRVYIHNGITFSFKPIKRYYFPNKKEDFKKNMIVELYNDTKWVEYTVNNIETEWNDIYKVFVKYEKIRIHRE